MKKPASIPCSLIGVILVIFSPCVCAERIGWPDALRQPAGYFATEEARMLASKVVTHQTSDGGWPKNTDFSNAKPDPKALATIDNHATISPLRFLALVIHASPDDSTGLRESFDRGFDYLLEAQYPNGGWPQYYPLRSGYHSHITFNDDAMVHLLELLRDAAKGEAPFDFIDSDRCKRATAAVQKGIDCILRTQVRRNGVLTVWCAQHHEVTLAPANARAYELASLSGSESAEILRFLMSIEKPSPEVVAAVNAGAAWFEASKISGIRLERVGNDRRVIKDPSAPPVWARFYDIETNRPFFCDRDGVKKHDISEIGAERRNGYAWYGDWGSAVAANYVKWKNRLE